MAGGYPRPGRWLSVSERRPARDGAGDTVCGVARLSGCARWACVRGAARGRPAPIPNAPHWVSVHQSLALEAGLDTAPVVPGKGYDLLIAAVANIPGSGTSDAGATPKYDCK